MKRLFKNLKVVDPHSKWHGKRVDILTDKEKILDIARSITEKKHKVIDLGNACISPGWLDIGTQIGEPGFEQRETLQTVTIAAMRGGFTGLASFPNTNPVIQSKSEIQFIKHQMAEALVDIYPVGAISRDCQGKDLTEMIDMQHAGAVAFSDGRYPVDNAGLMLRALEYSKRTGLPVISRPDLRSLHPHGIMHEGNWSTRLGMVGIPSMAEELCLIRDIQLNEYAEAKLIAHLISCKESVDTLKKAKTKKAGIGSSVSYLHLIQEDAALEHFNVMFKIEPPLRAKKDRKALIKGLKNGVIDAICALHEPMEEEIKDLEFSYAAFGTIGLETCFAALNTFLKDDLSLELIVQKLSHGPRKLLNLPELKIEIGAKANLTIFNPDLQWKVNRKTLGSKSINNPFLGKDLRGAVIGVFNKGQLHLHSGFNS